MQKLKLKRQEAVSRWDFLSTFKPPSNLNIEGRQIYNVQQIYPGCAEYEFVAS
jgi:hypothetical protein